MGCNAHNHPPGCTCGWGGTWYGTTNSYYSSWSDQTYIRHFSLPDSQESFVNPNARCPVCGSPVFYYSSPDGGRVFFDELGPPWPKHPCTDNRTLVTRETFISDANPQWQRNGWQPFLLSAIVRIDASILRLTGTTGDKELTLYVKYLRHASSDEHDPIVKNTLSHLRYRDDNIQIELLIGFTSTRSGKASHVSFQATELEPLA